MSDAGPVSGRLDDETVSYGLVVNARRHAVQSAWLGESLLTVLRDRLGLPGAKNACEQGECGSCSVLLDDVLVCACVVLAADAVGSRVVTVEGVGDDGLSDVQRAFLDAGAVQCGFCTPGLVVAVHDLLDRHPDADELTVREALSGNLCRCTGYGRIFAAVADVQRARAGAAGGVTSGSGTDGGGPAGAVDTGAAGPAAAGPTGAGAAGPTGAAEEER